VVEGLLQHDDWHDQCPICKEIVTEEQWPRPMALKQTDQMQFPPCIICGSEEDIHYNYLTLPQKDGRGFTHNMIVWCESCGMGTHHDGFEAISGKPKIALRLPDEISSQSLEAVKTKLAEAAARGEEDEEAGRLLQFGLIARAYFRVHHFPCLDDGWDAMGHGVRPLERTDIMRRFYEWSNDQAIGNAGLDDNPLQQGRNGKTPKPRSMRKRKKEKWW